MDRESIPCICYCELCSYKHGRPCMYLSYSDFISSGFVPRNGTYCSYIRSIFSLWEISILFSIRFVAVCISTKCIMAPLSVQPWEHFLLVAFWIAPILSEVMWHQIRCVFVYSGSLRWIVWSFIWDPFNFFFFSVGICCINLPLNPAFMVAHKFWYAVFSFLSLLRYF